MRTKTTVLILIVAATTACAVQSVSAQSSATLDRTKVLRAAADALGMARWSDIGAGATRLPAIDVVNTMEFSGSGTSYSSGQTLKTEYHAALGYNPPAMRVEMTRTVQAAAPHSTRLKPYAKILPGTNPRPAPVWCLERERQHLRWIL